MHSEIVYISYNQEFHMQLHFYSESKLQIDLKLYI